MVLLPFEAKYHQLKKGGPGGELLGVTLVELLGAERLHAGLLAAVREGDKVEGEVEEGHLDSRWAHRASSGVLRALAGIGRR